MTEGPNYGTGSNVGGTGTIAWTSPENAGADDASNATATLAFTEESNYLSIQELAFSVSGTVDGITVEIEWSQSGKLSTPSVVDTIVTLTADGSTPVGDNKAIGSDLPLTPAVQSFGGAADLWGTTWSAATINGATFGPMASFTNNGVTSRDAQVDFIRVTVDYTPAATTDVVQRRRQVREWRLTPEPELVW